MSKSLSLLFALISTFLLALISYFISTNQPWLALGSGLFALCSMGLGFVLKARQRRKREKLER